MLYIIDCSDYLSKPFQFALKTICLCWLRPWTFLQKAKHRLLLLLLTLFHLKCILGWMNHFTLHSLLQENHWQSPQVFITIHQLWCFSMKLRPYCCLAPTTKNMALPKVATNANLDHSRWVLPIPTPVAPAQARQLAAWHSQHCEEPSWGLRVGLPSWDWNSTT